MLTFLHLVPRSRLGEGHASSVFPRRLNRIGQEYPGGISRRSHGIRQKSFCQLTKQGKATSTTSGSGTRRPSSGSGWVVVVLGLLVVGVVFVPELRELMRVILVALWALLLDLFAWLADAIRSLTG